MNDKFKVDAVYRTLEIRDELPKRRDGKNLTKTEFRLKYCHKIAKFISSQKRIYEYSLKAEMANEFNKIYNYLQKK